MNDQKIPIGSRTVRNDNGSVTGFVPVLIGFDPALPGSERTAETTYDPKTGRIISIEYRTPVK